MNSVNSNTKNISYYILYQLPPGEKSPLRLGTSVGYQGIPLDPQGPKMGWASRISGPDQRGRLRQVPGGPALARERRAAVQVMAKAIFCH